MAVYDRILSFCGLAAGLGFALLALSISADIILRNIGILNFPWLLEVAEYVVYVATFLAAPWVLNQAAHVRVDVLLKILPRHASIVLEILADVVGLVTCAVFAYYSLTATLASFEGNLFVFKELVILEWPLLATMPAAGIMLAVEFARRLHRALGGDIDTSRITDGL